MNKQTWTDPKRVEALVVQWAAGIPASQISKNLGGVSKSAVCSKASRLGLVQRAPPRPGAVRLPGAPPRPVNGKNAFPPSRPVTGCGDCRTPLVAALETCGFCVAAKSLGPNYFKRSAA